MEPPNEDEVEALDVDAVDVERNIGCARVGGRHYNGGGRVAGYHRRHD